MVVTDFTFKIYEYNAIVAVFESFPTIYPLFCLELEKELYDTRRHMTLAF